MLLRHTVIFTSFSPDTLIPLQIYKNIFNLQIYNKNILIILIFVT